MNQHHAFARASVIRRARLVASGLPLVLLAACGGGGPEVDEQGWRTLLNGSDLSGAVTAQALIDAIAAIGGPNYIYIEIAPSSAGSTGGEPGGNIRNGFLYNIDRVSYVDGSAQLIEAMAYDRPNTNIERPDRSRPPRSSFGRRTMGS